MRTRGEILFRSKDRFKGIAYRYAMNRKLLHQNCGGLNSHAFGGEIERL